MSNYPNITPDRYEEIRKAVLSSVIKFCSNELNSDGLDSDQKESLLVAKQCLETTYEIEETSADNASDLIDLFYSNNLPLPDANASELEAEAEEYKVKGNDAMKENNYTAAIEHYSKAIKLFNKKAIYYCNRAAAFSRMERHRDAVADCKEAIKLDPSYGKAYGRLGIAYANMNMYRDAANAYRKALELDPNNASYESNLRLAEDKIAPTGAAPVLGNFDFGGLMNNPALLNMASQMLNDPSFRNMVSGIISNTGEGGGDPMESFVEVGQQLAEHMQQSNPAVLENIRQSIGRVRQHAGGDAPPADNLGDDNIPPGGAPAPGAPGNDGSANN
ncbi:small glutamine-rich tetratricopeptide repeat-containing protein beta [Atheta coriaria]|uniref:small glutamine-rich tetratricopeptide repeat-containing protein beta n=1 Tax=Dalotia coriaria TaxID=877792 RepID=UPI0031F39207